MCRSKGRHCLGPGYVLSDLRVETLLDLKTMGNHVREDEGPLVRCPRPGKGVSTMDSYWIYCRVITTWWPLHSRSKLTSVQASFQSGCRSSFRFHPHDFMFCS